MYFCNKSSVSDVFLDQKSVPGLTINQIVAQSLTLRYALLCFLLISASRGLLLPRDDLSQKRDVLFFKMRCIFTMTLSSVYNQLFQAYALPSRTPRSFLLIKFLLCRTQAN